MARTRHVPASIATEDLVIPQGADWQLGWKYAEDDAIPPDWPAGWIGRAQARETYGGALYATFHSDGTEAGEVVLDTATDEDAVEYARVTLVLDGDASAVMTWGDKQGVYDLELVHVATDRQVRMLEGKMTLSAEASTDD